MDSRGNHHGRGGRGGRGGHRGGHHGPGHHGHHEHHGGPPGPGHHEHHGHHKKHHGPGGPHGFGPGPGHFPPPHHGPGSHFPHHGPGGKGHCGPPKEEMWKYEQFTQQPMEYVKPQEVNVQVTQVIQEQVKQSIPVQKVEIQQQQVVTQNNNVKEEDQFMCGICESEKKNSFFEPCMHLYACEACAKLILEKDKRCPICMKSISGVKKIFIA